METNKINRISESGGYEPAIAIYDGKFSSVYAMILFICHRKGWNYMNRKLVEKARTLTHLGKYNLGVYYYEDGVTYSCIHNSIHPDALTGDFGSKYEYKRIKI